MPRAYKRAYDPDPAVVVYVHDAQGGCVASGHVLTRDPSVACTTCETGHIRAYTDYESYWYPFDLVDQWISAHWPAGCSHHIAGLKTDMLRGEPAQLAIPDAGGHMDGLLSRLCCAGR